VTASATSEGIVLQHLCARKHLHALHKSYYTMMTPSCRRWTALNAVARRRQRNSVQLVFFRVATADDNNDFRFFTTAILDRSNILKIYRFEIYAVFLLVIGCLYSVMWRGTTVSACEAVENLSLHGDRAVARISKQEDF